MLRLKTLETRNDVDSMDNSRYYAQIDRIREQLARVLTGKNKIIDHALASFFGEGHILLEGPPGTGKTSLAKGMARVFGGKFSRIQMTSDLLPSDVIGFLRLKPGTTDLEFREGPVFTNILVADELNRCTPKTQGSLLEAMEEGTVSVDGKTYNLPQPFFVVATQNPLEFHGVYPLAESQLDRFSCLIRFSHPEEKDERAIYENLTMLDASACLEPVVSLEESRVLRKIAHEVHVDPTVFDYVTKIVRATREISGIGHGVSVRGGRQFLASIKGLAFVRKRNYCLPADVKELAGPCLAHRLFFSGLEVSAESRLQMIEEIISQIPVPR